jgi:hypothetical protein
MELSTLTPELPSLLAEMGVRYDPERLAAALSSRPTELAARSLRVAASLGGFITKVLADLASGSLEANAPQRAGQLRAVLSGLGPSFVKTGQALSGEPPPAAASVLAAHLTLCPAVCAFLHPAAPRLPPNAAQRSVACLP